MNGIDQVAEQGIFKVDQVMKGIEASETKCSQALQSI